VTLRHGFSSSRQQKLPIKGATETCITIIPSKVEEEQARQKEGWALNNSAYLALHKSEAPINIFWELTVTY
jgi:hypothetical protein